MADDKIIQGEEIWKSVDGYGGQYDVSNMGQIRSRDKLVRAGKGHRVIPGKILRASNSQGYRRVALYRGDGTARYIGVHILVCEAFLGSRPQGKQVAHANGLRSDNRVENLRWATPVENNADKDAHGTSNKGERHSLAILTESCVRSIRTRIASGENNTAIARDFGVGKHCIYRIKSGKSWWWLS